MLKRTASPSLFCALAASPLLAALSGCGGNCDTPWYRDRDGDNYGDRDEYVLSCAPVKGYVRDARDCDDREPATHPGVNDVCNGIDDDCDGQIDPDARRFFSDVDGDGVGVADVYIDACSAPPGYVSVAGDCNDADSSSYPGAAVEACDGRDNDCDGLIDELVEGDTYYYPDNDGDGFGLTSQGERLCAAPSGWVELPGDCDDGNDQRYPGAQERCNNIDDDCDNAVDLDDPGGVTGLSIAYPDSDLDGYGAGSAILVCAFSLGLAANADDCDDSDPDIHPLADEVCGGGDEDCDGLIDDSDNSVDPATRFTAYIDADADGLGDPSAVVSVCALTEGLVVNALDCDDENAQIGEDYWRYDGDGDGAGGVILERGSLCAAPGTDYVNVAAPFDCDDTDTSIREGAPDVCGDGVDSDCTGLDPICGSTDALASLDEIARTHALAESASDALSVVSAPMDIDGDGVVDVWLGAPGASEARLLSGPIPEFGAWTVSETVVGAPGGGWGSAIAPIRDVTGDGRPDVAVGGAGAELVAVLRSPDWSIFSTWSGDQIGATLAIIDETAPRLVIGEPALDRVAVVDPTLIGIRLLSTGYDLMYAGVDQVGTTMTCCADAEGDGVPEIVLGSPYNNIAGVNAGRFDLAPTDLSGYALLDSVSVGRYDGENGAALGTVLSTGHDIDGDGLHDILATAPGALSGDGAGYLFSPTVSGSIDDAVILAIEGLPGVNLGASGTLADLDGDGAGDVLLGAQNADVAGPNSGAVYLFFGPRTGRYDALDADRVWYGSAGQEIGSTLFAAPYDVDAGDDVWVGSALSGGSLWLVPGR